MGWVGDSSKEVNKAFFDACREGNVEAVQAFLADPTYDASPKEGFIGAVSYAAFGTNEGHTKVMKALLADPRIEVIDGNGHNELSLAVHTGNLETVKVMLADPRIDPSVAANRAIIMAACCAAAHPNEKSRMDIVRMVLADPRVDPFDNANEALSVAASYGNMELVKLLLADSRFHPETFRYIFIQKNLDVTALLLADGRIDPGDCHNQNICNAAEYNRVEILRMLLADARVDPAARDNYPIRKAAENGHIEVVKELLADPRVDPTAALQCAIDKKHYHIARLILNDYRFDDKLK